MDRSAARYDIINAHAIPHLKNNDGFYWAIGTFYYLTNAELGFFLVWITLIPL